MTFGVGSDTRQENPMNSGFAKDGGQEFTPSSSFAENTQREQLEWIIVLLSKPNLWWRWVTIIWFSTWMVFLWRLVKVKLNLTLLFWSLTWIFFHLCKEIHSVHMVIGNEKELFEALGHNRQKNRRSPFDFRNTRLDSWLQKWSLLVGKA
jgi:hypothetical protein